MPKVVIQIPEGVRRDFVELQVRRAIEAERARIEFVEDITRRLGLNENDLRKIEKARDEAWQEFKRELGLE